MQENEELTSEKYVKHGLQLLAFTRSMISDERACIKIVNRSFEKLAIIEGKYKFNGEKSISLYLMLTARTLVGYYLKTSI